MDLLNPMTTAIVTTTIHVPTVLDIYMSNAQINGHHDTVFIVVADRKTPDEAKSYCETTAARFGFEVEYLDVPTQKTYLQRFPELNEHIPYDSIQRRNIGMLRALETGMSTIITIDDDNIPTEDDYIGSHLDAINAREFDIASTPGRWFNICDFLTEARGIPFYPRGYSWANRWTGEMESPVIQQSQSGKVVVNAGLWVGDPDVDALTRLYAPVDVIESRMTGSIALAPGTWCPFNSQNTALAAEVIPAYFLSPSMGRYDDIWASYVVKAIADHLDRYVCFGAPVVRQTRNAHNNWDDLANERAGMDLTDTLCAWLGEMTLSGTSFADCYAETRQFLQSRIDANDLSAPVRTCFKAFTTGMGVWSRTIQRANVRTASSAI